MMKRALKYNILLAIGIFNSYGLYAQSVVFNNVYNDYSYITSNNTYNGDGFFNILKVSSSPQNLLNSKKRPLKISFLKISPLAFVFLISFFNDSGTESLDNGFSNVF